MSNPKEEESFNQALRNSIEPKLPCLLRNPQLASSLEMDYLNLISSCLPPSLWEKFEEMLRNPNSSQEGAFNFLIKAGGDYHLEP